jgi:subtilisin-like proprotein convertase family protein
VDITHTYIGDLRLVLTAPSGITVVLHDRNGGRMQNIRRVFDPTNTPGLTALIGQPIQGNWSLLVQDLAAVDTGLLNRWEIEVSGFRSNVIRVEEAPGVTIPDNDARGIERQLNVAGEGKVADIAVDLDITHTYIGDLSVVLVATNGARIPLHERSGKDTDNLIGTYTIATTPALAALRGQPAQGIWRLQVADLDARDVGKLNRWGVRIDRDL